MDAACRDPRDRRVDPDQPGDPLATHPGACHTSAVGGIGLAMPFPCPPAWARPRASERRALSAFLGALNGLSNQAIERIYRSIGTSVAASLDRVLRELFPETGDEVVEALAAAPRLRGRFSAALVLATSGRTYGAYLVSSEAWIEPPRDRPAACARLRRIGWTPVVVVPDVRGALVVAVHHGRAGDVPALTIKLRGAVPESVGAESN